ncbi:Flavin-dependent oxidoreductase [Pseudomonas syringae pv. actinidiae]|uniref:Flavin-dependent oxidoreductase n=1 Tax=Pseudomonas syringae pv. actinidiae TaxID=103796 RepID=A0A2V0Q7F0_PSESF|nr:Flavin-dependent oxidoreductase [Pseudomonas syringae pv. actinidiae]
MPTDRQITTISQGESDQVDGAQHRIKLMVFQTCQPQSCDARIVITKKHGHTTVQLHMHQAAQMLDELGFFGRRFQPDTRIIPPLLLENFLQRYV